MRASTVCFILVVLLGIALVVIGAVLFVVFPSIIEDRVKETLNLETKSGMSYENWQKGSLPLEMRYFFFNVTNARDVVFGNAMPKLEEKGPYYYIETRVKVDLEWNSDNGTVDYRQIKQYVFDPSRSTGTEDDFITIPNIPAIAIAKAGRYEGEGLKKQLGALLMVEKLYVTKTVRQLLFEGYKDKLSEIISKTTGRETLPNNTFAFFYNQNMSDDGVFSIFTGKKDVHKYTVIDRWNGSAHLDLWKPDTRCNDINGTDGTQFPPFVKKTMIPRVYVPEICRSTYLVYEKEVKNEGILTYRFTSDLGLMADPAVNPENECFCSKDECMYTGLISMNKCQKDAPIFMSPPHFYQSSPLLLKSVEGLKPSKEKHGVYVDIEPLTGTVLNARRTSQVNIAMETLYPEFVNSEISKMPQLMHPVLWLTEGATIDKANADKFKEMADTPVKIGKGVIYGALAVGSIILLVVLVVLVKKCRRTSNSNSSLITAKAI